MAAMENTWNNKSDKDLQLHLNFDDGSFKEERVKKMDEINQKYPHAKLRPDLVTKGDDGEWLFSGKKLEEEAKKYHALYSPDEDEDWRDR